MATSLRELEGELLQKYGSLLGEIRIHRGPRAPVWFRRTDGLVDGGTIAHLEELQASQRALHETLSDWRLFR